MAKPPGDPDIKDEKKLDAAAKENLGPLDKHHIALQRTAFWMAVAIIVALSILEVFILCNFSHWQELGGYVVFLATAPIASTTVIVAFLLIGAFRSSQPLGEGPNPNPITILLRHASGNLP